MTHGLRIARETLAIGSVSRNEVLRYLGYQGQQLSTELDRRIDDTVARCIEIGQPRMSLASYDVREIGEQGVALEGCTLRLTGRDIVEHLADAREVEIGRAHV